MKKRIFSFFCALLLLFPLHLSVSAENDPLSLDCVSAILIEQSTGTVLYEKEADIPLPPASVTKIMTLLLIAEAIDEKRITLADSVETSENAASMGGSQIFLEPGESMTVEDMIKSIAVASANDAAVAMAEFIAGSEEAFVDKMNEKAKELGMTNTHFVNPTGLDDSVNDHLTTARDISLMSRELLRHEWIFSYTKIWTDTVRNGQFGLTNTNRLIRFYNGANGLKTGSTAKAKFCMSASAERNGMQLIAVIMASPTRDIRNESAKKLLDYGFANYARFHVDASSCEKVRVLGGALPEVETGFAAFDRVLEKAGGREVEKVTTLDESVTAPVKAGQKVGEVVFLREGKEIGRSDVVALTDVERLGYFGLLHRLFLRALLIPET